MKKEHLNPFLSICLLGFLFKPVAKGTAKGITKGLASGATKASLKSFVSAPMKVGFGSIGKAFGKVSLKTIGKIGIGAVTGATIFSVLRGNNPVTDAVRFFFEKVGLDIPAEIINLVLIGGCICIVLFVLSMRRR